MSRKKDNLMAVLACLLWSSAVLTAKTALEYQSAFTLASMRFLLAAVIQIPLCGGLVRIYRMLRSHYKTVVLVSFFHTIYLYGSFFIAMQFVRAAEGAIIIGSGPIISAIVAHIMMRDDKLNKRIVISALMGGAGVVAIALSGSWTAQVDFHKELIGILLLLSGSIVSAIGNVIVAKQKGTLNPIVLNSAQMFIGGFVLGIIALCVEGKPTLCLPVKFYAMLGWLAVISALGFSIWFDLLSRIKVSQLNMWKFLIPVCGASLSWMIKSNESPTIISVIGMMFIVCGIFFSQRNPQ